MKINTVANDNLNFRANKMPRSQAEYFKKQLLASSSVDIFCHVSTDEDAFSSAKIMYEYLEDNGTKARIICSNAQKNYGYDKEKYDIIDTEDMKPGFKKADTALCLDFGEENRLRGGALDYLRSFDGKDIFCIDHHVAPSPICTDPIVFNRPVQGETKVKTPKNGYIDTTAKSTTSILSRFFQSLNEDMPKDRVKSAYCGMLDDMNKSEYLKFGTDGKVIPSQKLKDDKNAYEVFKDTESKLSDGDKREIVSHLDVLSCLNEKEKNFRKNMYDRMQFNENGTMAYVVIPPDDESWIEIGGDNPTTSKILRDFRIRTLEHKECDEFLDEEKIEKLKNVQITAVFYPDYKSQRYRISLHSNKDYAEKLINYNREHYDKNLVAGGHKNRSGGSIAGLGIEDAAKWTENFIASSNAIQY